MVKKIYLRSIVFFLICSKFRFYLLILKTFECCLYWGLFLFLFFWKRHKWLMVKVLLSAVCAWEKSSQFGRGAQGGTTCHLVTADWNTGMVTSARTLWASKKHGRYNLLSGVFVLSKIWARPLTATGSESGFGDCIWFWHLALDI